MQRQLSCLSLTETLRLSEVCACPEPDRGFRVSGLGCVLSGFGLAVSIHHVWSVVCGVQCFLLPAPSLRSNALLLTSEALAAVERMWHTSDSNGQILALA